MGGNVSGTWTAEEGPYIIQGDIRVPENETLNIEAETEVRFDGQYFLRIVGNINVNGAPGDYVSFVSNTGNNLWKGLKLDSLAASSDTARFSHCRITGMNAGQINVIYTNKVIFEDSRIFNNSGHFAGCFYSVGSNITLRRCQFDNNTTTNQSDGGAMYMGW